MNIINARNFSNARRNITLLYCNINGVNFLILLTMFNIVLAQDKRGIKSINRSTECCSPNNLQRSC